MDTRLHRISVLTAFGILIALLIGNTALIRRQLHLQIADHMSVVRSRDVQIVISETQSLLVDAETGQRGFLYTGNLQYLKPYNDAVLNVEEHINHLREITLSDQQQQRHVAALAELASLKLQEMANTIALYRSGKAEDARSLVLSDRGLMVMNDFRAEIARMRSEEDAIEKHRDQTYRNTVETTIISLYVASIVSVLGLALLGYFILRERVLRDRHAAQLREREEWFRVTLTSIGDAVIATDAEGRVTFLNAVASHLTGYADHEAKGQFISEVFPIFNETSGLPVSNPVIHVMRTNGVVGLANHTALRHRDGRLTPIEDSAAPIRNDRGQTIGVVLVFHDVTADRAAQEVLRKTEKLAAAARLSATVAHEINNPLEAVTNLLFLAASAQDLPPAVRDQLALAEQELERVAHITRQTLGFYRESNQPEPVDMAVVVAAVLNLYRNKIEAKRLQIERDIAPCPPVWANAGELRQVVSNLLSNAIDAAPLGGQVAIRCTTVATDAGKFAQLIVEDSGNGVHPDHRATIFDPFFTTKKDVGTGLGLWVSQEIVSRHNGTIELRDHGTLAGAAFAVLLPAYVPQS